MKKLKSLYNDPYMKCFVKIGYKFTSNKTLFFYAEKKYQSNIVITDFKILINYKNYFI